MAEVTFTFKGMNNVADPSNVGAPHKDRRDLVFTEGVDLLNLDPSNAYSASLRQGRGAPILATTTAHSGWANPYAPVEAYFVDGTSLKRLTPAGAIFTLRSDLLPGLPMSFVQVNDVVRYGNGVQSGIIENGVDTVPFVPTDPFKAAMVPGQFVEWFNGRLYALQSQILYCSDPLDVPGGIESMDTRFNIVAVFDGPGQMLQRVDGGLFVSAGNETFFLRGDDPMVAKTSKMALNGYAEGFEPDSVAPYAAIPGTVQPIKAELLGIDGWQGWAAIWASEQGICVGSSTGAFINITQQTVAIKEAVSGTAAIRQDGGMVHYVLSLQAPNTEFNLFRPVETVTVTNTAVTQVV